MRIEFRNKNLTAGERSMGTWLGLEWKEAARFINVYIKLITITQKQA